MISLNKYLKKIIIGSANFNTVYNKKKISRKEISKIFRSLNKYSINKIDTSNGYNNYELLLNYDLSKFYIFNKIKKKNIKEIKKNIIKIKKKCLEQIFLSHDVSDFNNDKNNFFINELKIKNFVYSIYDFSDLNKKKINKDIYIQLPYNILMVPDYKSLNYLKKNKCKIMARSVFMRGYLYKDINFIIKKFKFLEPIRDDLIKICNATKLKLAEISFLYTLMQKNVDYVILGIESDKELKKNIKLIKKKNINKILSMKKMIKGIIDFVKKFNYEFDLRKI